MATQRDSKGASMTNTQQTIKQYNTLYSPPRPQKGLSLMGQELDKSELIGNPLCASGQTKDFRAGIGFELRVHRVGSVVEAAHASTYHTKKEEPSEHG